VGRRAADAGEHELQREPRPLQPIDQLGVLRWEPNQQLLQMLDVGSAAHIFKLALVTGFAGVEARAGAQTERESLPTASNCLPSRRGRASSP